MKARITKILIVILAFSCVYTLFVAPTDAQSFSGSDPCNYYCPKLVDESVTPPSTSTRAACPTSSDPRTQVVYVEEGTETGQPNYVCWYKVVDPKNDNAYTVVKRNASPYPPTLTQVEVWAVRILYVAWAVSGIYFTLVLMWIGFLYLTARGNDNATADAIRALRKWILGFALVFLSYPALNTFFAILPLNTDVSCYEDVKSVLPGFQLVFPQICKDTSAAPACANGQLVC